MVRITDALGTGGTGCVGDAALNDQAVRDRRRAAELVSSMGAAAVDSRTISWVASSTWCESTWSPAPSRNAPQRLRHGRQRG
jgi:hypothetical protein